jgi:saccharopine dehydrogenase-like NADP-dependent oxidoreductase
MGKTLSHHLSQLEYVGKLIVADLDGNNAERVANELAGTASCEVTWRQVDILNDVSLDALLTQADFLVNAAGPFFRLGLPTLKAAIRSHTPYLDICDDPEPTIEMMALDAEARSKDVAALIGMGASPGVSNLMARRAASRLDDVMDCYTAWPLDVEMPGGEDALNTDETDHEVSAALVHFMEQISGTIDSVIDGKRVKTKPLEQITLNYPGAGKGTALTVGHPEPITLHKSLGVKGRSSNLVLVKPSTEPFMRGIANDIDAGRLTLMEAAEEATKPSTVRTIKSALLSITAKGPGTLPPFFALLTGTKDGVRKAVGCHATTLPAGMAGATSIPAAIAVDMLLRNPAEPGVHAPEDIIDAEEMLDRLRDHCTVRTNDVEEMMPLSEMVLD